MKLIVEEKDLLEGNFDEELIDDVLNILDPLDVEVVYEVEKKKKVNPSGCTKLMMRQLNTSSRNKLA